MKVSASPRPRPHLGRGRLPRLAPWWLLLTLLAFIQSPGRTAADTKLDLVADPWGFLTQATRVFTDVFPLGQLQNQAYGYLWPHGLFFAVLSPLPDWFVQRAWWALLLCLAFTGMHRLLAALRIGSPESRILAGLLYALSPRIIATIGAISSEAWTFALAPWVLVPLLSALNDDHRHRSVFLPTLTSVMAVWCLGAVNAAATLAALVPAGLWLLLQIVNGPQRQQALKVAGLWGVGVSAVSVWWIVPLLILGRYSPPFIEFIESAETTTRWLNLTEMLRGATSWTPFVSTERLAGHELTTDPVLIMVTVALAAVGLAGLVLLRRAGRFWVLLLLLGVLVMGAGNASFAPFSDAVKALFDGSLSPFRNVHKFSHLVWMPLMVGLAHACRNLPFRAGAGTWAHPEKRPAVAVAMLMVVLTVSATSLGWSGRLAPEGTYRQVPEYWQQAADWLGDAHAQVPDAGRTLVVPDAPSAEQTWGLTRDEPLQALGDVPWVVRDAVPLVPPEAIRGLDGLMGQLDYGSDVPALAQTLRAQGIGFVLVRRDLTESERTGSAKTMATTLRMSDEISAAASFGKVEIFRVGDGAAPASVVSAADVLPVAGGPEVLPVLDAIDGAAAPRTLAAPGADSELLTVTDTPSRRSRNYGEVRGANSDVLAPGDDTGVPNRLPDYPVAGPALTEVVEAGGRVRVSSSVSDAYAFGGSVPGRSVNALVDRRTDTEWRPKLGSGRGEKITFELPDGVEAARAKITAGTSAQHLQITGRGSHRPAASTERTVMRRATADITIPGGSANVVTITLLGTFDQPGLAEVSLFDRAGKDITPTRLITVPDATGSAEAGKSATNPARWVFTRSDRLMQRAFTVHQPTSVRVRSSACGEYVHGTVGLDIRIRTGGFGSADEQIHWVRNCDEQVKLPAGQVVVETTAWWLELATDTWLAHTAAPSATPLPLDRQATGNHLSGTIAPADHARIVVLPQARYDFRTARITTSGPTTESDSDHTTELVPTTLNGWQQTWLLPAGTGGDLTIDTTVGTTYRWALALGLALAALLAVLWLALKIVAYRRQPPAPAEPEATTPLALPSPVLLTAGAVTLGLVAGWPGLLITAVATAAGITLHRFLGGTQLVAAASAGAFLIAGALLARDPWPTSNYAGFDWPTELFAALAVALLLVAAPPRLRIHAPIRFRAGSSTSAKDAAATGIDSAAVATNTTNVSHKLEENIGTPNSGNTTDSTATCHKKMP